jgi:hypothetical protein
MPVHVFFQKAWDPLEIVCTPVDDLRIRLHWLFYEFSLYWAVLSAIDSGRPTLLHAPELA